MTDLDPYVRVLELLLQTPAGVLALLFLVALVAAPVASGILQLKSNNRQSQVLGDMIRAWSTLIGELVTINHKNAEALDRLNDLLEHQQIENQHTRQMVENITTALLALTEVMGKRFGETMELVMPLPGRTEQTLAGVEEVQTSIEALHDGQDDILQAVQHMQNDVNRLHEVVEAQNGRMAQASDVQSLSHYIERVTNEVQSLRISIEQTTNVAT